MSHKYLTCLSTPRWPYFSSHTAPPLRSQTNICAKKCSFLLMWPYCPKWVTSIWLASPLHSDFTSLFTLHLHCVLKQTSVPKNVQFFKCDPTIQNELHWYLVTIQSATIFDLQVKNIDFRFSSKSGASGIFLFENITFNGQMWCFMTVSNISNCNCCNTVVWETFSQPKFSEWNSLL